MVSQLAGQPADPSCQGPQHVVAAHVPVLVVNELEMVDVQHDGRESGALPPRAQDLLGQPLVEGASIRETGQGVDARQAAQ